MNRTQLRCSRTQQTDETKAIIKKAKKDIDNGMDCRKVLNKATELITDNIQRNKVSQSIIKYIEKKGIEI